MNIRKFHIYLADLDPPHGTEPGKVRPVVVTQTDFLNDIHPSTVVCPITSRVRKGAEPLRIYLSKNEGGLKEASDIMVDQVRAIDNRRIFKLLGRLSPYNETQLLESLKILILE